MHKTLIIKNAAMEKSSEKNSILYGIACVCNWIEDDGDGEKKNPNHFWLQKYTNTRFAIYSGDEYGFSVQFFSFFFSIVAVVFATTAILIVKPIACIKRVQHKIAFAQFPKSQNVINENGANDEWTQCMSMYVVSTTQHHLITANM